MFNKNIKMSLLLILIIMSLGSIQLNAKEIGEFVTSPGYVKEYLKKNNIKELTFLNKEKVIKEIEKLSKQILENPHEVIYIDEARKGFKKYYRITAKETELIYIGGQKDNKPNGIGILFEMRDEGLFVRYGGQFKEGNYEGYGQYFNIPTRGDINAYIEVYGTEAIHKMLERLNYVVYEGEFKNNKFNGRGQYYIYPSMYEDYMVREQKIEKELSKLLDEPIILNYVDFLSGEFKNDQITGNVKIYKKGKLFYDGKMKNSEYYGKGTLYFLNSDQIQYNGNFKNGKYEGKGKLFDEKGTLIYSGKWKNGDYN